MFSLMLALIISFVVGLVLIPVVFFIATKAKAKQTILHYVSAHKNKQGTKTLGGLVFVGACCIVCPFLFSGQARLAGISLGVFLSFALLGFLDDFIKIRTHKNLGLKPYQKIIGQVGIAVLIAVFVYKSNLVGTTIYLPWGFSEIDIGWGVIPLTVLVLLALSNSANLTDGLDGLAGGVSVVVFSSLAIVLSMLCVNMQSFGAGANIVSEYQNLMLVCVSVVGGLLAFLCVNSHPAKIFMGDTGSLALGGLIGCVAVFTGLPLLLPLLCFCFMISALSVILQVACFKIKHKRIFLMAPLHHHFEQKGMNENKIVAIYIITTILFCALQIWLCSV